MLWCEACRSQEAGIAGMKHFSRVWITGSTNHKTSSVVDHATGEQHRAAMTGVRAAAARAANVSIINYAPIARSLEDWDEWFGPILLLLQLWSQNQTLTLISLNCNSTCT